MFMIIYRIVRDHSSSDRSQKGAAVSRKNKNALVVTTAAVLTIVLIFVGMMRLVRFLAGIDPSSNTRPVHSSSDTAPETASSSFDERITPPVTLPETSTEEVTYPAESLPDYSVHTLPQTTEAPTTEEPTTPEPTTELPATPEETLPPETTSLPTETESPETEIPNTTEFSENSDNLPFIGTWLLEYDLAPAQAEALMARYSLPRIPEKPVILRLSAVLADNGTLRIVFMQKDADAFKKALSDWYAEAASIFAESGAGTVQKAAFASWAAYRKGLYSLLSPDAVKQVEAGWYAEGGTVYVTHEGEIQAEISSVFEGGGLTVTAFSIKNDNFRDTVSLMQSTLGFTAPYHLTRE